MRGRTQPTRSEGICCCAAVACADFRERSTNAECRVCALAVNARVLLIARRLALCVNKVGLPANCVVCAMTACEGRQRSLRKPFVCLSVCVCVRAPASLRAFRR
eukprot:8995233-Lingulodinium_polyedra.AAC.1